jgi:uncharacterized protein
LILVDANVLMYAAGGPHQHKEVCVALLEAAAEERIRAAVSCEVLQEVLHRLVALRRWREGRAAYDRARLAFPTVLPITVEIIDRACRLLDTLPMTAARDAVHAATVLELGLDAICSYDRGLDAVPGLRRVEPAALLGH